MFSRINEKILEKLQRYFSEKNAREYQKLHTQKLQEMAKNLPKEFIEIDKVLTVLNNNSWSVHHLFKKAKNEEKYADAFLYIFYLLELTLKHLIISEMGLKNSRVALRGIVERSNFFSIYSEKEILEVLEIGLMGQVITKFCIIFGKGIEADLRYINNGRNYIIHNMLKKEMSEFDMGQCFEKFFKKSDSTIKKVFTTFDKILKERPKGLLEEIPSM